MKKMCFLGRYRKKAEGYVWHRHDAKRDFVLEVLGICAFGHLRYCAELKLRGSFGAYVAPLSSGLFYASTSQRSKLEQGTKIKED